MTRFTISDAATALSGAQATFVTLFQHGSMKIEWYQPQTVDKQTPHKQDELYVIALGSGTFYHKGDRIYCTAGDVLFVPAGDEHRFENFSDDFATWVIFYGRVGGE